MSVFVKATVGIAAYFAALLTAYDMLVFAETRVEINRLLSNLGPSEINPSPEGRKAFQLDRDDLYPAVAFQMYRREFLRRGWDEVANFHGRKIIATPMWAISMWLWYDRQSIEALELRMWCCEIVGMQSVDAFSTAAFGKTLNALSPRERDCIVNFYKYRWSRSRTCPEILKFRKSPPAGLR